MDPRARRRFVMRGGGGWWLKMGTPEFHHTPMQRLEVDPNDPTLLHVPDWKAALRDYAASDELVFLWPFLRDKCKGPLDFVLVLVVVPPITLQTLPFASGSILDELLARYARYKSNNPKRAALYAQLVTEAVMLGLKPGGKGGAEAKR